MKVSNIYVQSITKGKDSWNTEHCQDNMDFKVFFIFFFFLYSSQGHWRESQPEAGWDVYKI